MFRQTRQILEMIRFSHTVFALPFALLAAVMAWTIPVPVDYVGDSVSFRWRHLLGIVLCMVLARSAAMAFNRLVDRRIDASNPRTNQRHLVIGALPVRSVWAFTCICSVAFILTTLLFLPNRWPLYLSCPVLGFLLLYSYTKRFTALAHFWLGAALMLAPVCAWIAIRGPLLSAHPLDPLPAILLGAAVLLWVGGFDILYACQDVEFDRQARLYSIPSRLGVRNALRLAAVCHAGMVMMLAILPVLCPIAELGWVYWITVAIVALLLVYEHWLVTPDDLARVNVAFFHVNAILSIGLFLVITLDLLT